MALTLRPHQERAIALLRTALRTHRRVVLVMPTGSGKTACASVLMNRIVERGQRAVFLVHRREIVKDTVDRLRRDGIRTGVVMANEPAPTDERALVCSVQTLHARKQRPPADVLFWDECHHSPSESYREIQRAYPNALHIGLTAWPERSDGVGLVDAFDELVVGATIGELIQIGQLVPCDVVAPPKKLPGLAWDPLNAWKKHAGGRRTVVFAKNVAHAEQIAASFAAAGVASATVHAKTSRTKREDLLAAFDDDRITAMCNVGVLTEGWDSPATAVCLMARSTESTSVYVQTVGRVLRASPGKPSALLLDLAGNVHQHGMPDCERNFTLDGLEASTAPEQIRTCKECGAVFRPRPACPKCGAVLPPQPVPKITPAELQRITATVPEAEKLRAWVAWRRQQRDQGKPEWWARWMFKQHFGYAPPSSFYANGEPAHAAARFVMPSFLRKATR